MKTFPTASTRRSTLATAVSAAIAAAPFGATALAQEAPGPSEPIPSLRADHTIVPGTDIGRRRFTRR